MNKLEQRISDELTAIDLESRYDSMLDECYPEIKIGYLTFSPSRVLAELDPIAYRCGMSDWESSEGFIEIGGDYYEQSECEKIRDELVSELESEVADLELVIEEEREQEEPSDSTIDATEADIAALTREIKEWNNYSF